MNSVPQQKQTSSAVSQKCDFLCFSEVMSVYYSQTFGWLFQMWKKCNKFKQKLRTLKYVLTRFVAKTIHHGQKDKSLQVNLTSVSWQITGYLDKQTISSEHSERPTLSCKQTSNQISQITYRTSSYERLKTKDTIRLPSWRYFWTLWC